MVFYRTYRPQSINQLDSAAVREELFSVLSQDEIPHAFLFTGPKGLGKTSTARIVAKAINCEKKNQEVGIRNQELKKNKKNRDSKEIEPCNTCEQCISITNGTNLDVLEIDGASNRGIDEIRDLREKVRLAPLSARKKLYIIDEVHMLTTEAFNALLKTLEEPPSHVMFIFCTTEPHKVPDTIVSRCFHIAFPRATADDLIRSFQRIADGEKLKIEEGVMLKIAELSDGGFRDGAKILEELAMRSNGQKITEALIDEKYQVSSIRYTIKKIIELLSLRDTKASLQVVSDLEKTGLDFRYFIEQLIGELHVLLLSKVGVVNSSGKAHVEYKLTMQDIKRLVELLSKAHSELRYAVLPQLPLELAIIEWGMIEENYESRSMNHELKEEKSTSAEKKPRVQTQDGFLDQVIQKVKQENYALAGVLRGCMQKSFDGNTLVLETRFKFHKDRLSDTASLELLGKISSEVAGNPVKVLVLLQESGRGR